MKKILLSLLLLSSTAVSAATEAEVKAEVTAVVKKDPKKKKNLEPIQLTVEKPKRKPPQERMW